MSFQTHTAIGDQCIVMPLQPAPDRAFDGVGLALHFLLGNVVVLHSGLKELWFGWRVQRIFKDAETLSDYCRGQGPAFDFDDLGRQEKARLWVHGQYDDQKARVAIHDAGGRPGAAPLEMKISCSDGLVGFRQSFLDGFERMGLAFPEAQQGAALWAEKITLPGLDAVGRALEAFYRFSAFKEDWLDLAPFEQAVSLSPRSFMAHSLMGWAHYRCQNYPLAVVSFNQALTINASGAGVMAGLMHCAVQMGDLDEARRWAVRKAGCADQDAAQADKRAVLMFQKRHRADSE